MDLAMSSADHSDLVAPIAASRTHKKAKGEQQRYRRVRYKLVNADEPDANACCLSHVAFFVMEVVNEALAVCTNRRLFGSPWQMVVAKPSDDDPILTGKPTDAALHGNNPDRDHHKERAATPQWQRATPEQSRPVLQSARRESRQHIARVTFISILLLLLVVLILLCVLCVQLVLAPRQPPSELGATHALAAVWHHQARLLEWLGVMTLPSSQKRYPYDPLDMDMPAHALEEFSKLMQTYPLYTIDKAARAADASASVVDELQAWLATVAELDGVNHTHAHPPPAGCASWIDALAGFLGGGARWRALVQAHALSMTNAALTHDVETNMALRVLRGRKGYTRAHGEGAPEAEVRHPTDDVALLQWRHALSTSAADEDDGGGAERLSAVKLRLYGASSVLNRRFYHGVRRLERAAPYASASAWSTKGWYDAVAGAAMWGVYGDAGAVDADALSRVNSVRLRVDDLSKAAVAELESYEQHADVLPPWRSVRADVPSVFVSLASYRDVQCAPTLLDLFRKAKNPHRVYVGLAEQNRAGDVPCVSAVELHEASPCVSPADVSDASAERNERALRAVYGDALRGERDAVRDARRGVCFYAEHVRLRTISADVAKGPTYGRYMAMLLYRGESFTLVLDSHNRFTPFWDSLVTHQHYRYDDPKTVLSHYPPELTSEMKSQPAYNFWTDTTRYQCGCVFLRQNIVRMLAANVPRAAIGTDHFWLNNFRNDRYTTFQTASMAPAQNFRLPQPWVAGGFLFANSSIMREVPFDPHLPQLFDGEEVLYSVRLWTHGYNIFSPVHNIVYHYYTRPDAPKVWLDRKSVFYSTQAVSRHRVNFYLQSHEGCGNPALRVPRHTTMKEVMIDADRFGLGSVRTVAQWYNYSAVDPLNCRIGKRFCV